MNQTLYLECNAGISGDMTVAALLDLGADAQVLSEVLASIPAKGFETEISRVKKAGIDCCDFRVRLDAAHENHDHDMAYLHGTDVHGHGEHTHAHDEHTHDEHTHAHDEHTHDKHTQAHEEHTHGHDEHTQAHDEYTHDGQTHTHGEHMHAHEHRGMQEITEILNQTHMTEQARKTAFRIFEILAQAEAKAHAVPLSEVHFHEVGAIDSIVDIVAVSVCLDNLGIREVIVPKLCEGTGTIRCQHGILPVPVPAVANIVAEHGLTLEIIGQKGEFVTPTGAAIVAAVRTGDTLPEQMKIKKIGIGAGKRRYERPSMVRAMLIEDASARDESAEGEMDRIYKLESNIDDCSGEALGYVMEKLFAAGARDVHYHPVFMKKNRPGWQLNVICSKDEIAKLERIIFRDTTTIGIRRLEMERSILKRRQITVQTPLGEALVKVCEIEQEERYSPEYESVAQLCRAHDLPYQQVYQTIMREIGQ